MEPTRVGSDSGGNAKNVKEFYNCISKPFLDVPLSQVGAQFAKPVHLY